MCHTLTHGRARTPDPDRPAAQPHALGALGRPGPRARPVSDSMRELVEAFLGELDDRPAVPEQEVRLPEVGPRRGPARRRCAAWSAPSTCTPTTPGGSPAPAASPPPTCSGCAPATAATPPTPSYARTSHDEVAAVVALVRRARRRARALRRRDVRRGRPGRPPRRLRRRRRARPAPDDPARRRRHGLRDGDPRGRAARPRGGGAARRARPDARPLPAVLPLRLHRRLRRHPVQRPVLGRLRPLRLDGDGAQGGHPARRPRARQLAGQRRRARPARARDGLRGRLRRDHRGDPQGATGARGEGLRGAGAGSPSRPAPTRCGAWRRPLRRAGRCRRCCGSPTRPRPPSTWPAPTRSAAPAAPAARAAA